MTQLWTLSAAKRLPYVGRSFIQYTTAPVSALLFAAKLGAGLSDQLEAQLPDHRPETLC
jgi:hypothetical protein